MHIIHHFVLKFPRAVVLIPYPRLHNNHKINKLLNECFEDKYSEISLCTALKIWNNKVYF